MADTGWPVVYAWRLVPKFSYDPDIETGIEPTEQEAKDCAEKALIDPHAVAAIISPIALVLGEWVRAGQSKFGLRTSVGSIRWIDAPVD